MREETKAGEEEAMEVGGVEEEALGEDEGENRSWVARAGTGKASAGPRMQKATNRVLAATGASGLLRRW